MLERLCLVRDILGRHGIECDAGRELGGVVTVDAVALEQTPVLRGAFSGRTGPVLGRKPSADSGNAERGGACCVLTQLPRPGQECPTPDEAVPLDSSATR